MSVTFREFCIAAASFIQVSEWKDLIKKAAEETRLHDFCDSVGEVEIQIGLSDQYQTEVSCADFKNVVTFGDLYEVFLRCHAAQKAIAPS